jgi:hypothetical protein
MSAPEVKAPLQPRSAAAVLESALGRFRGDLTVADAAARTGLALRDAESGLRQLASRRGGHLKATDEGALIYSFPTGLERAQDSGWAGRFLRSVGRGAATVGRFVVRAWVSVVLVAYAAIFIGVMIAMSSRDDDRGGGIGGALSLVGNLLFEAMYWTFHPFSPVSLAFDRSWADPRARRVPRVPFYERVNRFVFGPSQPAEDPRAREKRLIGEIRRLGGRVGPADIMRVTGGDREEAERELLRLVVDYEGDIEVAEGDAGGGAIVYVFKALRKAAGETGPTTAWQLLSAASSSAPAPIWSERVVVPPLTGNGAGTNIFLTALNGFNLAASSVAVTMGLTIERLSALVAHARAEAMMGMPLPPLPPAHDVPLLLGWVPLVFSGALFALPISRVWRRRRAVARAAAENGRRALLRLACERVAASPRAEIAADEAERAWTAAAGARRARTKDIEAAVRELGGDIDITDDGAVVYRFETAAREARALAEARAAASADEASPGRVVFSSSSGTDT